MSAPTPADLHPRPAATVIPPTATTSAVLVPRPSVKLFDYSTAAPATKAQTRARRLNNATNDVADLARALTTLRADSNERDLDLNIEKYHRTASRVRRALEELDFALAAGPAAPAPTARYHA